MQCLSAHRRTSKISPLARLYGRVGVRNFVQAVMCKSTNRLSVLPTGGCYTGRDPKRQKYGVRPFHSYWGRRPYERSRVMPKWCREAFKEFGRYGSGFSWRKKIRCAAKKFLLWGGRLYWLTKGGIELLILWIDRAAVMRCSCDPLWHWDGKTTKKFVMDRFRWPKNASEPLPVCCVAIPVNSCANFLSTR